MAADLTALVATWRTQAARLDDLPDELAGKERTILRTCANELNAALATPGRQEPAHPTERTPEWGVVNCLVLARRRLNALRQRATLDALLEKELEAWEHVKRICELSGAKTGGVLREALPTEITDGEAGGPPPAAWLPIATAPKDRDILLAAEPTPAITRWLVDVGRHETTGGVGEPLKHSWGWRWTLVTPTHWQPLPAPPASTEEK